MTSPGRRPRSAAGDPGSTEVTITPLTLSLFLKVLRASSVRPENPIPSAFCTAFCCYASSSLLATSVCFSPSSRRPSVTGLGHFLAFAHDHDVDRPADGHRGDETLQIA